MKRYTRILAWCVMCLTCTVSAKAGIMMTERLALLPEDWQGVLNGEYMIFDTPENTQGKPNKYDGSSYIKELTNNYLLVQVTDASTLQLKCVYDKNGFEKFIGIYTVYGPAGESDIRFFDAEMKQLPTKDFIKMPQLKDFFKIDKGCKTTMKEIQQMLPFTTIEATVSPDNDDLTFNLTCEDYVSVDDYNILKLFLQPVIYHWQKGKYNLVNN